METLRVLVVEDSAVMRKIISKCIRATEMATFEVTTASGGLDALQKAANAVFDLVFVDWTMPQMSGLALTKALRSSKSHRSVPIVMITSNTGEADEERAKQAGVDLYVYKPVNTEVMRSVVGRALELRHRPRTTDEPTS